MTERPIPNTEDRLKVEIVDGRLVISIGIGTLAFAAEMCSRFYDEEKGEYTAKVTNQVAFAKEVVNALEHEQEDGTTPVHILLDDAFDYVVGDGGEGIEV